MPAELILQAPDYRDNKSLTYQYGTKVISLCSTTVIFFLTDIRLRYYFADIAGMLV